MEALIFLDMGHALIGGHHIPQFAGCEGKALQHPYFGEYPPSVQEKLTMVQAIKGNMHHKYDVISEVAFYIIDLGAGISF